MRRIIALTLLVPALSLTLAAQPAQAMNASTRVHVPLAGTWHATIEGLQSLLKNATIHYTFSANGTFKATVDFAGQSRSVYGTSSEKTGALAVTMNATGKRRIARIEFISSDHIRLYDARTNRPWSLRRISKHSQ